MIDLKISFTLTGRDMTDMIRMAQAAGLPVDKCAELTVLAVLADDRAAHEPALRSRKAKVSA